MVVMVACDSRSLVRTHCFIDDKDGWHCQLIADKNIYNIYDLAAREISIIRKFLPEKDSENNKIWKYCSSIEECYEVFCAVLRAIEK